MTIQCSTREAANAQRDDGDQVLRAVKFTDKKVPVYTWTWMKTYKPLAVSQKLFVAIKWG